ncbi:prolactin [Scophthalmus maximus]|uniref:Prolactin n=1 Tax=Scophthalmus maximus TaxID=52904 RepID=A0A482PEV9_SCOMX|nr:prolactin [Scophthalmus maximus]QBS36245.1 prolactin [Scophthalmus maximus]
MAHRRSSGGKLLVAVLYVAASCSAVPTNDLLDRASQHSDKMHSLSTILAQELDSHFPPIGRVMTPRPSMCHTSSLQTPSDKAQALQISGSDLLSLARSLLQAWVDPLVVLSDSAYTLPHPAHNSISNKIQELQEHSKILGDGLDVLSSKMGPEAQTLSLLPYTGNDIGQDRISKLINFHFLMSCFRRDSHKIDSFLKVLRCRAAKMQPEMC